MKASALAAVAGLFAASWIDPPWPEEQSLHSVLTVVGLVVLTRHARRWPMRHDDFLAACAFLAVHILASRWLYSYVPYDAWLQAAFGWSPQWAFGWERNHFDRLVHLLYGLCLSGPLHSHLRQRWPGLGAGAAQCLTLMLVMSTGLIYEWAEWGIAAMLSPEDAEAYNGQQGDVWDAHMDMLLAALGSALSWIWLRRRPRLPASPATVTP